MAILECEWVGGSGAPARAGLKKWAHGRGRAAGTGEGMCYIIVSMRLARISSTMA